jgi:hypothetical protein
MKHFFISTLLWIAFSYFFPSSLFAQLPPDLLWARTFGGEFGEDARMIVTDQMGGFVAAGMSNPVDHTVARIYIVHVDGLGQIIWQRVFDYGQVSKAKDIHRLPGQGYLVTGYRQNNDGSGMDGLLLLLNNAGQLVWDQILEGPLDDVAWRTRPVEDGFVLMGITASNPSYTKDAFIAKFTFQGELIWYNLYGSIYPERTTSLVVLPDGGFALAGMTRDTPNQLDNGWLLRTDSEGNELWQQQYGGDRVDEFYWVESLENGGFILCGRTQSNHERDDFDMWVVETDEFGEVVRTHTAGDPEGDDWAQMIQLVEGGYILTGLGYRDGRQKQVTLVRLDEELNVIYSQDAGSIGIDMAYAIRVLTDGGYVIAGKATRLVDDNLNMFIARTEPDILNMRTIVIE